MTNRYPCRKPLPWRVLDGETLVVDPAAGRVFPLNTVGTRIWELCDGARTVRAIVATLTDEFDADGATIERDAMRFLDDLTSAGLITLADTPASPATLPRRRTTAR